MATALTRSSTLFISEDWVRIYEAIQNVDFRAVDFENLVQAIMEYLRVNYSDQFNDWIASSEFVTKIEILGWLAENINFRSDLNTRENFLATASRRESLLRLAQNICYKVNRARGASGEVRLVSIRTTQSLTDSNGIPLQNREILWNDPANEDWYEWFITVMNRAFSSRTQFGRPLVRFVDGVNRVDQYVFNSIAPSTGVFPINADVSGQRVQFEVLTASLDPETGIVKEIPPTGQNAFRIIYRSDGRGTASTGTGFFLPIKQGTIRSQDETYSVAEPVRTTTINATSIDNDDVYVQQISQGEVSALWTKVDTVFGEGVAFNDEPSTTRNVYELDTLTNDRVLVRFGDGKFGAMPVGTFRYWYRVVDANPVIIKADAIQNVSITIPYANEDQLFYLTMTFSLTDTISNASSSETLLDIRRRANLFFYTQNRMITGLDYNGFMLRDNSIKKLKTVNRTYAGHSRYAKLHDPTGFYEGIKAIGEDGRLYIQNTSSIQMASADTDILPLDTLINEYLKPVVAKEDKRLLYYNNYPEKYVSPSAPVIWDQTSVVARNARGNFKRNGVIQPVGSTVPTSDPLHYVDSDSFIRYNSITGPVVSIERVIFPGTTEDAVILRGVIPDGVSIASVMPPLRNRFTTDEITELKSQLVQRLDVGLTWNQTTRVWQIISYKDLNKTGTFSLSNQGNVSGLNLDSSWMVYLEFIPGTDGNDDQWRIVDRGVGIFFESAREIDFIYTKAAPVVDGETGRFKIDNIKLLGSNESKNSMRRRGLTRFLTNTCGLLVYTFIGDGVTKCFKTKEVPIRTENTVVLVDDELRILNADYTISSDLTGDSVCFVIAPPNGSRIEVRIADRILLAKQTVKTLAGNGSLQVLPLGVTKADTSNIISTIDGVFQNPGRDYSMTVSNGEAAILYDAVLPAGTLATAYTLGSVTSQVFVRSDYIADGATANFRMNSTLQTQDSCIVILDGIWQTHGVDFTINTSLDATSDYISFTTIPPTDVKVVIYAAKVPSLVRARHMTAVGDGVTAIYEVTGISAITPEQVIVTLDGVLQDGPYHSIPAYTINGQNRIQFATPPATGLRVTIHAILGAIGIDCDLGFIDNDPDGGNIGCAADSNISSCYVSYLGCDVIWHVSDVLRHPDGYTNENGLFIKPADEDQSGLYDNPYLFQDIVLTDNLTDLVLWRKVNELGFNVWDPISKKTSPQGTYGTSAETGISIGASVDEIRYADGDIHYDLTSKKFLRANLTSGFWEQAPVQSDYRFETGRDDLKFLWTHYSPDSNRIDPSQTNLMDAFLLPASYYDAYQTWIRVNGRAEDEPEPPTSQALQVQYQKFDDFKATSDALLYHVARFKPLFGPKAIPELQATFKVVKTAGTRISDNDLRLRILRVIEDYLDADNWEFGAKFYYTELAAFIHSQLAPDVQSIVIVPNLNDQAFGRLFQIRAEPDELFISGALPSNIQIVASLTDEELRIGAL